METVWYIYELESNLRRRKLHRTNQGSFFFFFFFLGSFLGMEIMQQPQSNLEEKDNPLS